MRLKIVMNRTLSAHGRILTALAKTHYLSLIGMKTYKEKMLAKSLIFVRCGYEHRPMFDAQQTTGDWVVDTVLELTVPKGAHPDGHYEEGDKPARKTGNVPLTE